MKRKLLASFLLFFCIFHTGICSNTIFVHRDQLFDEQYTEKKKEFYLSLQKGNEARALDIRAFKDKKEDRRNIILASLHVIYDEDYQHIEEKDISKIFLSGWLPTDSEKIKEHFGGEREVFCLGSAYKKYDLFDDPNIDLFGVKKGTKSCLSQAMGDKLQQKKYEGNYTDTFMYKLVQDFGLRNSDFEFAENKYNHQNCAHTEQAFFSYIEHSLNEEHIFDSKETPKSVLVNMVSYLPICDQGFCLRAIHSLISAEDITFKKAFLKRISPKFFERYDENYQEKLSEVRNNKSNYLQQYEQLCKAEDDKIVVEGEENNKEQNKLNYKNEYENLVKTEEEEIIKFEKLFKDININVLYTSCDWKTENSFNILDKSNFLFQMRQ